MDFIRICILLVPIFWKISDAVPIQRQLLSKSDEFIGRCKYTLIKDCRDGVSPEFDVTAEMHEDGLTEDGFPSINIIGVEVLVHGDRHIKLDAAGTVTVDGKVITNFPYIVDDKDGDGELAELTQKDGITSITLKRVKSGLTWNHVLHVFGTSLTGGEFKEHVCGLYSVFYGGEKEAILASNPNYHKTWEIPGSCIPD
ncbi:uncharacterized protein LOC100368872 [Saccoglossus kowalevskii]|uniref:Uncharacterized protein LOC100368872 n=1 Tax=Saccoglossus kowalevskii TaxID=10224 RepID=A0ABM0GLM2_SACKO|nr:PREDICTED: uncharacterized protein LOC100368872 [Saccoglossus kowalevskii]